MAVTHLSHALLALLDRRELTATALAAEIGVHQVTVSRACAGERLAVESLRALCTHQTDPRDGLDLLLAHLRDEVERAGRLQTEVVIAADDRDAGSDIRLLEEQSREDQELRAILHDLAQLVRSIRRKVIYPQPDERLRAVAEEAAVDAELERAERSKAPTPRAKKPAGRRPGGARPS